MLFSASSHYCTSPSVKREIHLDRHQSPQAPRAWSWSEWPARGSPSHCPHWCEGQCPCAATSWWSQGQRSPRCQRAVWVGCFVLLLARTPSPLLFPSPSQQKVPRSAIEESQWSGLEKVGGRKAKKQGNIYKIFSHLEIFSTIKDQALADYKSLKFCLNNDLFLLVNQICSNDQKGYLISVINASSFHFFAVYSQDGCLLFVHGKGHNRQKTLDIWAYKSDLNVTDVLKGWLWLSLHCSQWCPTRKMLDKQFLLKCDAFAKNSPEVLKESFLKDAFLWEQAEKPVKNLPCWAGPEGLLYVTGRWKGKMQETYLQIKNHCIDLEVDGLQK